MKKINITNNCLTCLLNRNEYHRLARETIPETIIPNIS